MKKFIPKLSSNVCTVFKPKKWRVLEEMWSIVWGKDSIERSHGQTVCWCWQYINQIMAVIYLLNCALSTWYGLFLIALPKRPSSLLNASGLWLLSTPSLVRVFYLTKLVHLRCIWQLPVWHYQSCQLFSWHYIIIKAGQWTHSIYIRTVYS